MAFVRRRAPRRRAAVRGGRRKGFRRRRFPLMRGPGPNKWGIHYFTRTVSCSDEAAGSNLTFTNGGITQTTTGSMVILSVAGGAATASYGSFGWQFNIANVPSATDFTNLFDHYQLRKVVIKCIPYSTDSATTVAGAPNGNPAISGFLHYCIDKDDVTHPAASDSGVDTLRQRPNYKCRRIVGQRGFNIVIKPRTAQEIFRSAVTTGYGQGPRNQWLDIAFGDLPHYGLIGVFESIQPNAGAAIIYLRMEVTYYIKTKGVR